MKRFLLNFVLFLLLLGGIIFSLLSATSRLVASRGFTNYNTESNTLFLPKGKQYDLLFMGISHARNFSRYHNHLRVEKILDAEVANIAQGEGRCGLREQLFYLDYFYYLGNKNHQLIYVLSPPMLFSTTLPQASDTFNEEIFSWSFFWRYLRFSSTNKTERIISYLQTKTRPIWLLKQPDRDTIKSAQLDSLDRRAVIEGQDLAYGGSDLDMKRFQQSCETIERTLRLAISQGSEVVILIPPALFGRWRGHDETMAYAKSLADKYDEVSVFDGATTVLDPTLYYDNHHLNTAGVEHFCRRYLLPLTSR